MRTTMDPTRSNRAARPQATADVRVRCSPTAAFELLTDLDRLAEWNALIDAVVDRPAELTPGAVWKVAMRKGGMRWVSRSEVVTHDPSARRFTYRSGTDDGNPSYSEWSWSCDADGEGTIVRVGWRLHPVTRLRRWLIAPLRARMLRREVPVSMEALRALLEEADRAPE